MVKEKLHFIPDRGDIVQFDFSPRQGHEQAGVRPALVLTSKEFNQASGILMACPITNTRRFKDIEIPVSRRSDVSGVVLVAHIRSIDWISRQAKPLGKVSPSVLAEIGDVLKLLLHLS